MSHRGMYRQQALFVATGSLANGIHYLPWSGDWMQVIKRQVFARARRIAVLMEWLVIVARTKQKVYLPHDNLYLMLATITTPVLRAINSVQHHPSFRLSRISFRFEQCHQCPFLGQCTRSRNRTSDRSPYLAGQYWAHWCTDDWRGEASGSISDERKRWSAVLRMRNSYMVIAMRAITDYVVWVASVCWQRLKKTKPNFFRVGFVNNLKKWITIKMVGSSFRDGRDTS